MPFVCTHALERVVVSLSCILLSPSIRVSSCPAQPHPLHRRSPSQSPPSALRHILAIAVLVLSSSYRLIPFASFLSFPLPCLVAGLPLHPQRSLPHICCHPVTLRYLRMQTCFDPEPSPDSADTNARTAETCIYSHTSLVSLGWR
ncbi:hypothetical protein B0H21DRAFT_479633 [Amylocystis lapponica]|nr:hypothetical protein B0H21DRAFT_479633 [Amylocystis lapponica]